MLTMISFILSVAAGLSLLATSIVQDQAESAEDWSAYHAFDTHIQWAFRVMIVSSVVCLWSLLS